MKIETFQKSLVRAYYGNNGIREVWKLAFPMIISTSCSSVMIFCDRLFLSKLSVEALAGSLPISVTMFCCMSYFLGLLNYINAISSQYFGAKNYSNCSKVLWQGVYIAFFAYIIMLLLIYPCLIVFNKIYTDPQLLKFAKPYFIILMSGSFFFLVNTAFSSFFVSIGNSTIVMYSNFSAMLLNIPLNYLLMFGLPQNHFFNFNGFGAAGAAYASITSTFVCFAIMFSKFMKYEYRKKFSTLSNMRYDSEILKKLLIFGNPAGVEFFINILAFNLYVFIFGKYGKVEQSAVNIAFSWNLIAFLPLIGISAATTALVGRNLGAENIRGAFKSISSLLKIGFAYISVLVFFYAFYPAALINIFKTPGGDSEFIKISTLATDMLRLTVIYLVSDVLLVIYGGALRGAGDTKFVMYSSIAAHWLFLLIPSVIAFKFFNASSIAVWKIFIVFSIVFTAMYVLRFYNGRWKNIKMI